MKLQLENLVYDVEESGRIIELLELGAVLVKEETIKEETMKEETSQALPKEENVKTEPNPEGDVRNEETPETAAPDAGDLKPDKKGGSKK